MNTTRTLVATVVGTALLASALQAQWLKHPTPGIPRRPDGTPNVDPSAPRMADGKPDLSGIWSEPTGKYVRNLAAEGPDVLAQGQMSG